METLVSWFAEQANIVGFLQVGLDLALIGFVAVLIVNRRNSRGTGDGAEVTQSLDKIMAETKAIAQELDANMQERHKLIQQVVTRLDQRLDEARELCQKLDTFTKEYQAASSTSSTSPRNSGQREILRLARLGLDPDAISQRLQKPLGEVELVLSLKRLTPDR